MVGEAELTSSATRRFKVLKSVLLDIGPNEFFSGTAYVSQWCKEMNTFGPHVFVIIH